MNGCLDFRRSVLADPHALDSAATEHKAGCPACAQFHEQALQLDAEVLDAARVEPPAGLSDRLIDGVFPPARWYRPAYAIAASVMFALVTALGIWYSRDDPMASAGIDFVVDEEAAAILMAKPSDPESLMLVASRMDVRFPRQLGEIRYIGTCPFGGGIAHHVVVISPAGKVTLLLLPDHALAGPGRASGRGLKSLVEPARGGSIAIIANSAHAVERTHLMFRHG